MHTEQDVIGAGHPDRVLTQAELTEVLHRGLAALRLDGARVLVIVPDATRSIPLDQLFDTVYDTLAPQTAALDVLIALGTHPMMTPLQIADRFGCPDPAALARRWPGVTFHNHRWDDPATFVELGRITAGELAELSGGRLVEDVPVRVNRMVTEYDACLVVGPVFPHEVVGFSGGDKYFFPGVSGPELINVSHWLGALITSVEIIGTLGITPVRALIERAAALIPTRRLTVAVVIGPGGGVQGAYVGPTRPAWAAAAQLSAQVNIRYLDEPVRRVVSVMPLMYDDIWTAAKGMYKLEPVVADGGELIIYAPHVRTFSITHDRHIRQVGYHCRDYFLADPARFADVPRGVLAHSTHLRGAGSYDPATGRESGRITVTLATAIPAQECRAANLSYRDPAGLDLTALTADPETLVVPRAGELLYRLR
ncbi:Nickel-dependent lactate racemase [Micromonospora matsumotoense]|uniref:Nickel-dependent lactate racemase n=1 Tax=Micromonospora matsumotoense TaxID=121616 RepID=A0A1C5AR28_9ACTN|nr:lactate racemase domain-containing protein [Micromonospora matsumotoense]SCF47695.1 Nickel-dependent lactate racemase [Micromonospora matsumotoense]